MKIVNLIAENVKRLTAVEITPDGNLVQITGRNRQGKTSVLDSIWWALAGSKPIQSTPIRKGAEEARIELNLGDFRVIRTFRRKAGGDEYTTSLAVENADGARFPSPQTMLDKLLGEFTFDPPAFARMCATPEGRRKQFDALRKFVPDVDFEAIDNANKGDRERRTDLNRFADQERAAAMAITVPANTPAEPVDKSALVAQLEEAGKHNEQLVQRRSNRDRLGNDIRSTRATAEDMRKRAKEAREHAAQLIRDAEAAEQRATELDAAADAEQRKLTAAPPLPAAIDTAPIVKAIADADAINENVRRAATKAAHLKRAKDLEAESQKLTDAIKARDEAKRAKIAAAKMPIEGLSFGDGCILLNGMPFEQASDAEQLEASVAIAAALNSKLRVIRIRDGSLLDDLAMQRLAKLADSLDLQIWIERVDGSGKVGFVIEDGHVKASDQAA